MRIFVENYLTDPPPRKLQGYEVEDGCTLGWLLKKLDCEQLNAVINGVLVPSSYVLKEGDVVTLFTVMSGG